MKKCAIPCFLLFLLILTAVCPIAYSQNVGIGTTSPHPNAALEIQATNKGLLIPRGDAATRNRGDLSVIYNGLVPYLIEANKEQQQIEMLAKKVEKLTKK